MALWIFGDSFSVARSEINKGDIEAWPLWHEIVTHNLNLEGYYNYSQWGVSNEYIFDQFIKYQLEYKEGDCIVIQLTSSSRQWFFEDRPELANFYITDIDKILNDVEYKAVQMYINYLHRSKIDELRYFMVVSAFERLSQLLPGCRVLLLPGFHPIPGVLDTLMNICNGEFVSPQSKEKWYRESIIDSRPNHFGQENHQILGARISEFFQTGKLVDLLNGYKKEFR